MERTPPRGRISSGHDEAGIAPRDLERAWSLAIPLERDLEPFTVLEWEPVSEYAARLFRRYRELRLKVLNHRAEESAKRASLLNRYRVSKQLAVGDVVVLRDPRTTRAGGRTPWRKQLTGPYTVVQISPSGNKLELKDEATGKIQEAHVENVVLLPPGYKSWEATGDSRKTESRPMRFREQEEKYLPRSLGQMLEEKDDPTKKEPYYPIDWVILKTTKSTDRRNQLIS